MNLDVSAGLWFAVIALGVYHGVNPAMGWPLAVANGLSARRGRAVFTTLLPLGAGHLLAMAIVLVPFAALSWYAQWGREIRIVSGALVLLFGLYKLADRRHPRFLVRIRPSQLTLWSFLMATAHGAGLMLVPIVLGLCARASVTSAPDGLASAVSAGHQSFTVLVSADIATALLVAAAHTLAMVGAGLVLAWLVYRHLGLRFLRQSWFNLEAAWALSLVVAGGMGCALAIVTATP